MYFYNIFSTYIYGGISMKKKTMDLILILVGASVVIFTIVMIWIYLITGGIPDTLCTCFFIACTGECGFMGWIKTAKTRYQDHEWQEEYEKKQKELMEAQAALEEERKLNDILGSR